MRNRCAALLLLAGCIVSLFPAAALAEGETVLGLSVGTLDGAVGSEVTVPVEITDCAHVDSLQFNLNYDSTALAVKLVEPGRVFPAEYVVVNSDEQNRLRVACISALGLSDEGVMLNVTFTVLKEGGSAISISDAIATTVDAGYEQHKAYVAITEGGVTTGGALPAPVVTPWIAETPEPTPSPEPTPTLEPTPVIIADTTEAPAKETPAPGRAAIDRRTLLTILIVVAAVLALAVLAIVFINQRNKRRRKRRKAMRQNRNERK